jgi:hypothetical protein
MVVFADAHSVATLIAARIEQGLAHGTAPGAVGAGMLDIDQGRDDLAFYADRVTIDLTPRDSTVR